MRIELLRLYRVDELILQAETLMEHAVNCERQDDGLYALVEARRIIREIRDRGVEPDGP